MGFIKEFKEFAVKGNVMDMAVGVIIGGAFGNQPVCKPDRRHEVCYGCSCPGGRCHYLRLRPVHPERARLHHHRLLYLPHD